MSIVHQGDPDEAASGGQSGLRRKDVHPGKLRAKRATAAELCASRWRCIQRLFVTIGDDACMVATQIVNLAQATSDSIEVDRAERQERQEKAERLKLYSESDVRTERTEMGAEVATEGEGHGGTSGEQQAESGLLAQVETVPELEGQVVSLLIDCVSQLPVKTGRRVGAFLLFCLVL